MIDRWMAETSRRTGRSAEASFLGWKWEVGNPWDIRGKNPWRWKGTMVKVRGTLDGTTISQGLALLPQPQAYWLHAKSTSHLFCNMLPSSKKLVYNPIQICIVVCIYIYKYIHIYIYIAICIYIIVYIRICMYSLSLYIYIYIYIDGIFTHICIYDRCT